MKRSTVLGGAIAAILLSGCDMGTPENKAPAAATALSKDRAAPMQAMAEEASRTAKGPVETQTPMAPAAKQAPADNMAEAAQALMEAAPPASGSAGASAMESLSAMAVPSMPDAQSLIDQAMQYLSENKLDMAGSVLEKLKAMQGSLPESLQGRIAQIENLLSKSQSVQAATPGIDMPATSIPMPMKSL